MSHISGKGYGFSHKWERGDTEQVSGFWGDTGGRKKTNYRCKNCRTLFTHYYDEVPDIFEAMRNQGIINQCPAITQ